MALKLKQEIDRRKEREQELRELTQLLKSERERSNLLLNMLPEKIAERLRQHPGMIAEHFDPSEEHFS